METWKLGYLIVGAHSYGVSELVIANHLIYQNESSYLGYRKSYSEAAA